VSGLDPRTTVTPVPSAAGTTAPLPSFATTELAADANSEASAGVSQREVEVALLGSRAILLPRGGGSGRRQAHAGTEGGGRAEPRLHEPAPADRCRQQLLDDRLSRVAGPVVVSHPVHDADLRKQCVRPSTRAARITRVIFGHHP